MSHVVANKSFEIAGTTLGSADQWTSTYVSTEELHGDFDRNQSQSPPDTIGNESFDEGWVAEGGNLAARPQVSPASIDQIFKAIYEYPYDADLDFFIFDAVLEPKFYTTYERFWLVIDPLRQAILWPGGAVQPDYQYSVTPPTLFCDFSDTDPNTFDPESFENFRNLNVGWYGSATKFIAQFEITDIQYASFGGSGSDENFEKWPGGVYSSLYDSGPVDLGGLTPFEYFALVSFSGNLSFAKFGAGSDPLSLETGFIKYTNSETFANVRERLRIVATNIAGNILTLEFEHRFDVLAEVVDFEIDDGAVLPEPIAAAPVTYLANPTSVDKVALFDAFGEASIDLTTVAKGGCYMRTNFGKYWGRVLS